MKVHLLQVSSGCSVWVKPPKNFHLKLFVVIMGDGGDCGDSGDSGDSGEGYNNSSEIEETVVWCANGR